MGQEDGGGQEGWLVASGSAGLLPTSHLDLLPPDFLM